MVTNKTNGKLIANQIVPADRFSRRFKGLMFDTRLSADTVWVFPNCQCVHTFFMRYPITVLFLDADKRVIKKETAIFPWKISPWVSGAKFIIEGRTEIAENVDAGDYLAF